MKNILAICMLSMATIGFAQKIEPTFKAENDLVKATYFYNNGSIKTQGYFKNKKLTGEWVRFDKTGNKTQLAYYAEGKKVGKWFVWSDEALKEINYNNNAIASVNVWKPDTKLAISNE